MRSVATFVFTLSAAVAVSAFVLGQQPAPADAPPEKKFADFQQLVKGAKEYEGLFRIHHKDDHVYMEIQPHQFNRPLLAPMSIARGLGMGGDTLNIDEQWVVLFRRVGDKVHLVRRNVRFRASPNSPIARAVETTYSDSVLMALRIQALNTMRNSVVVDLNDVFFTNFANLPLGLIDSSRTTWHKIKAFPRNIELQVAATFGGGGRTFDESVIDPRGKTVVLHYSLVDLPQDGYQPRYADDRVGYFLTAIKDFSTDNRETAFVRYINRWRLERADGSPWKEGAKLVPPKKKIVFWIEKSVPDEYRSAVREGILEWNKAFEKIGFIDAIEVRQQQDEDFDPEDINYSTFRWLTHEKGYAIGPSRVNPLTGEIIDADITFDASMVRFYKMGHAVYKQGQGLVEPASLLQESQRGWSQPRLFAGGDREPPADPQQELRDQMRLVRSGFCQCAAHKRFELGLAAITWAARNPGEKVPDELIFQAIKETAMHEVGHTLGLRHNFKASTMLKNEQLHDVALTRKQGLSGSVMDYHPVNVAPKGVKQGDWFSQTIGPYDYWSIEYGYKPIAGNTDGEWEELQKIAARAAAPGLDFGTDEDWLARLDPATNQWDMGADPMKYALDRMLLLEELLKGLADRVVDKGDGYQRARQAFNMLLRQYGDAAYLIARYVGGEYVHRDHRGDPNGRDPMVPVKADKQREALKYLQERVFTDSPFRFSPDLLRKLAADRWMHWGNELQVMGAIEFPLNERILRLQRVALSELLDSDTLHRIQNVAWKADANEKPLRIAEVFDALTKSIWADLPGGEKGVASSVLRRNLQREHLQRLTEMVLGSRSRTGFVLIGSLSSTAPPDARSLARMHLRELGSRIDQQLAEKRNDADPTVRAHLEECKERITKALAASMQLNE